MTQLSKIAQNIIGSEIIKIAAEINERVKAGEQISNLTIGDFNPKYFPIPGQLKQGIVDAYSSNETNYPPADGILELRQSISKLLKEREMLEYNPDEILIAAGARPVIYSIFRTLVDSNEKVLFATPSWNNNHYTYLVSGQSVIVETKPENFFMPSAKDILPHIQNIALVALCSPQNPTGTIFSKEGLTAICDLIIEENKRRGDNKPVYLMYDQIYWALTYDGVHHYDPVTLRPEMRNYTVYVDGVSKSLSATGIRVGWSMGPKHIIDKMKAILTHIGAWAPRAEQIAVAKFLDNLEDYDDFIKLQRSKINTRLTSFYNGLLSLHNDGLSIEVIAPQAGIYLAVRFPLIGMKTQNGDILNTVEDITKYILDEARIAIVPFYAFGSSITCDWYRISIGTTDIHDISTVIIPNLKCALKKLTEKNI